MPTCKVCKKEFYSKAHNAKTCNHCKDKSHRLCKICGKKFKLESSSQYYCKDCKSKKFFCDCGCGKKIEFYTYLRGQTYKKGHKKLGTGKINNLKCVVCGSKTKKYNKTCSKKCYSKLLSIKRKELLKNKNFGKRNFEYNGIKYRSSWEVEFAKHLDDKGIQFEYEPFGFELSNGTKYFPDFLIKPGNLFVEIKGYLYKNAKQKIDLFIKEYKNINYLVIQRAPGYGWF